MASEYRNMTLEEAAKEVGTNATDPHQEQLARWLWELMLLRRGIYASDEAFGPWRGMSPEEYKAFLKKK